MNIVPKSPDVLTPAQTSVFFAVCHVHHETGRCTNRDVRDLTEFSSTSTIQMLLNQLRDLGLVRWDPGKSGTLRPAVTFHRPKEQHA